MLFMFYSACMNFAKLVFVLVDVIVAIERRLPPAREESTLQQCVFCLSREGPFKSEEHVLPEAFGVDDLILRDGSCDLCNNKLSLLDQYLAEVEPLALLRVYNVPLTKKGKFPRAETRDFTVEKVKPRVLQFTSKTGKRVFSEERMPDGTIKLSHTITTRRPVDMIRVARAIFKIALGVVAIDAGIDHACGAKFDSARAFIRGDGTMPNHMLMIKNVKPTSELATMWDVNIATVVMIDLFGVRFAVNLESLPLSIPAEAPDDSLFAFWLGSLTKGGIINPCRGPCEH